ncbi:hypothetical protein HDE_10904 [Halotydeus destructor]|nr:hypothetical protein HDE_10904 [Halotydeus destructor]
MDQEINDPSPPETSSNGQSEPSATGSRGKEPEKSKRRLSLPSITFFESETVNEVLNQNQADMKKIGDNVKSIGEEMKTAFSFLVSNQNKMLENMALMVQKSEKLELITQGIREQVDVLDLQYTMLNFHVTEIGIKTQYEVSDLRGRLTIFC